MDALDGQVIPVEAARLLLDGRLNTFAQDLELTRIVRAAEAERTCARCGSIIATSRRQDARYCDNACKQAAWRFGYSNATTTAPVTVRFRDGSEVVYPSAKALIQARSRNKSRNKR